MKIQTNGAVLVQIAPLFCSQPRHQNQSIVAVTLQIHDEKKNSIHMIHDKIYEKHKFINKLEIPPIHIDIREQAHEKKFTNK